MGRKLVDGRTRQKWKEFHELAKFMPTQPVMEPIDIRKVAQSIPAKESFVKITRVIFSFKWDAAANDWDLFAGGAVLLVGINFKYEEDLVLDFPLKDHFDIVKYNYDFNINTDGNSTKNTVFAARLSFDRFSPSGFDMQNNQKFSIEIGNDLSSRGDKLFITVEGWKWRK